MNIHLYCKRWQRMALCVPICVFILNTVIIWSRYIHVIYLSQWLVRYKQYRGSAKWQTINKCHMFYSQQLPDAAVSSKSLENFLTEEELLKQLTSDLPPAAPSNIQPSPLHDIRPPSFSDLRPSPLDDPLVAAAQPSTSNAAYDAKIWPRAPAPPQRADDSEFTQNTDERYACWSIFVTSSALYKSFFSSSPISFCPIPLSLLRIEN